MAVCREELFNLFGSAQPLVKNSDNRGIAGLLKSDSKLYYSKIDRQKVYAVAANEQNLGRSTTCLSVNGDGEIADFTCNTDDVICWQVANGESGNLQKVLKNQALTFADCTASGVDHLPQYL